MTKDTKLFLGVGAAAVVALAILTSSKSNASGSGPRATPFIRQGQRFQAHARRVGPLTPNNELTYEDFIQTYTATEDADMAKGTVLAIAATGSGIRTEVPLAAIV